MTAERFARLRESMLLVVSELDSGKTSEQVAEKFGLTVRSVRSQYVQWSREREAVELLKDHDAVFVAAITRLNIGRVRNLERFGGVGT